MGKKSNLKESLKFIYIYIKILYIVKKTQKKQTLKTKITWSYFSFKVMNTFHKITCWTVQASQFKVNLQIYAQDQTYNLVVAQIKLKSIVRSTA